MTTEKDIRHKGKKMKVISQGNGRAQIVIIEDIGGGKKTSITRHLKRHYLEGWKDKNGKGYPL